MLSKISTGILRTFPSNTRKKYFFACLKTAFDMFWNDSFRFYVLWSKLRL